MDRSQPSLFRSILADYTSYQAAILTGILWLIFIVDRIFPTYSVLFSYLVLMVSAATAALILVRFRRVQALFELCEETAGVIEEVATTRWHLAIRYEFTFRGERYAIQRPFPHTRLVEQLSPGQQVTVLVDPNNLQQSILRDIYC